MPTTFPQKSFLARRVTSSVSGRVVFPALGIKIGHTADNLGGDRSASIIAVVHDVVGFDTFFSFILRWRAD